MSTSSTTVPAGSIARSSLYRQYSRGSSTSITSTGSSSRSINGGSGNNCLENLPPRALARVGREVRDLHLKPPEGVRLIVDGETGMPSNLGELVAELEGPQGTPYEGKFFRLKLVLGSDFPASPPRGFFLTKIYHPNVDMSTGAICVNTLKKDWTAETTFSHVLGVIRCLLIVPFPESSLNDEAGKLFMESYDEYAKRARLMADVHATSHSVCIDSNKQGKEDIPENDEGSPRRKSRISESNLPLGSKNSNNIASSSSKSVKSKGTSSRMTKKKSLKRL